MESMREWDKRSLNMELEKWRALIRKCRRQLRESQEPIEQIQSMRASLRNMEARAVAIREEQARRRREGES